ncbi:MAG: phytanoyl-CoA dioxygenase family protein [Deltaproteobacteria bacterium]|nr:MAG: phytanoyl-CoA dioxygenase family protein [Deltaproteobacteria bacterium]TMA56367.1 MAG: phytanoyl-CoA dioxygenase family protein [Deltaproteobacteria bacterium]
MALERLPSSANPADVAAAIGRDGYAIVERVVAPEVLDRARAELQPHLDATPFGPDDFAGRRTRRTGGLIARSATCRDIVMHPLVLGAVGQVLGHVTSFQLHLTQVIAIGPGEPAQTIHRDQWAFDFFPFPKGYEVQCNTIWAMTDFTDANGATRIVPGSHRFEDRREFTYDQTEPAEMPAGSVLFYTGALYHGAGANRSDRVRSGLNVTYSVSWLRQEENQYLSVPAELARTLPDELLRLMGYARGAYALGYVDDLRDPLDALRGVVKNDIGLGDLDAATARVRQRAG